MVEELLELSTWATKVAPQPEKKQFYRGGKKWVCPAAL